MTRKFLAPLMIAVLALASAAPAFADGLPYRGSKVGVVEETRPFNWTGIYVDAGVGYGFGSDKLSADEGTYNLFNIDGLSSKGWKGNFRLGGDYRFSGTPFVLGVFGEWTPDGFGDSEFNASADNGNLSLSGTFAPQYAAGARLGMVVWNNSLLYVGAKHSWAEMTVSGTGFNSFSKDLTGWGGLAGIEVPLTSALTFSVEADYTRYGKVTLLGDDETGALTSRHEELNVMARLKLRTGNLFGN